MVRIVHIVMKLLENGTMLTAGIFWPNARDPRAEEWGGRRERRQEGQKGRTEEDQVLHPLKDWIAREFLRREVWLGRHLIANRALEWERERERVKMKSTTRRALCEFVARIISQWGAWCVRTFMQPPQIAHKDLVQASPVKSVLLDPDARKVCASQTQLYFCK